MTYCLGWRTATEVFLVADAAVTSTGPANSPTSSFGERHVDEAGRSVQEGALKIVRTGNAAVTFSGDADVATDFGHIVHARLQAGANITEAFRSAALSVTTPLRTPAIRALVAGQVDGIPLLLSFNADGGAEIRNEQSVVHLGALDPLYTAYVDTLLAHVERDYTDPSIRLACVLGLCQSFTIQNYLMEHGVGGAFCGIYVNGSGAHWLPDISYGLLSSHAVRLEEEAQARDMGALVTTLVRDDIFLVQSHDLGGITAFTATRDPVELDALPKDLYARTQAAATDARNTLVNLQCDFFTVISTSLTLVVVFELRGHTASRDFEIRKLPAAENSFCRVAFGFSKRMGQVLIGNHIQSTNVPQILFVPYEPPQLS